MNVNVFLSLYPSLSSLSSLLSSSLPLRCLRLCSPSSPSLSSPLLSPARRADLTAEIEANSKLQSRFDLLSSQLSLGATGAGAGAAGSAAALAEGVGSHADDAVTAPQDLDQDQAQGSGEWGGLAGEGEAATALAADDASPSPLPPSSPGRR